MSTSNKSFSDSGDTDKTIEYPIATPPRPTLSTPIKIPRDGSCFFKSLECIFGDEMWTSFSLRFLVARSVLEKDPIMDASVTQNMIELWKSQAQEQNQVEVSLMHEVIKENGMDRQQLFENMLDRHRYWGDQYAIMVIESILLIRILVILTTPNNEPVAASSPHDTQWYIDRNIHLFVILLLDQEHYEPGCQELLTQEELPDIVQELWKDDIHIFSNSK